MASVFIPKYVQGKLAKITENEKMLIKFNIYKDRYTHKYTQISKGRHIDIMKETRQPDNTDMDGYIQRYTDSNNNISTCISSL